MDNNDRLKTGYEIGGRDLNEMTKDELVGACMALMNSLGMGPYVAARTKERPGK